MNYMCVCWIPYYFISRLLLDISHLCNRSNMTTLILIREDTEKICNHHIKINKWKQIKANGIFAYRIISRDTRNSKASNILIMRERVRRSKKIKNFLKHTSPSYYATDKIKENERRLWKRSFALSDWQALLTPGLGNYMAKTYQVTPLGCSTICSRARCSLPWQFEIMMTRLNWHIINMYIKSWEQGILRTGELKWILFIFTCNV